MIGSDGAGYDSVNFKSLTLDRLPHPRSFGAFPRVFSDFVINKQILSWQEAIYKATSLPAKTLGIVQRGEIKEGFYAEIVIFNPEKIEDKATYENPFQFSSGVEWVFINGEPVIEEGKITKKKTGMILRRKN